MVFHFIGAFIQSVRVYTSFLCPLFVCFFNQSTWFPRVSQSRIGQLHLYEMDALYPPSIVAIVDNLFSYPYLRFVVVFPFIA